MPQLPAVERLLAAQQKARWLTTGWGAVGVQECAECGDYFEGAAWVFDDAFVGRLYFCARCRRLRRSMRDATPRPCEVCGRKFAWAGGAVARRGRLVRRPRPRTHVCSDACRRERRNRARRVRHDEKRRCAGCRTSFVPTRADQLYHSAACRQRAYRRRAREP